jgi:hypothetical protein
MCREAGFFVNTSVCSSMAWRGACGTRTGQLAVAPSGAGRPQRSIQRMRQRQDKERHHHRAFERVDEHGQ